MVSTSLPVVPLSIDSLDPGEQSLVRAARHDPAAFAQLYRLYLRPVFNYALARVGNGVEAEDLTAQTFLAAFEGIDRFRGECRFSTWLFGIARHKCSDLMRRHGRARQQVTLELAEQEPLPGPQMEELVEGWARMQAVANQLNLLSPEQAEAVRLRVFGGLSAAEAGEVMGKSEAAVKMLVFRAVRELRLNLADWMEAGQ